MRRQIVAAAGKKESVSLSLFMELNSQEVEEDLSTMATLSWTEGVGVGKWKKSNRRGGGSSQVRGPAGAVRDQ